MSDELKPCKHCGGEARFQIFDTTCNVECRECGIGTRNVLLENYQVCVDTWNRSADDAPINEKHVPSLKESTEDTQVFTDSRERLEADVRESYETGMPIKAKVLDWLDRQAAITEREHPGLAISDDESLISWHGENYLLQSRVLNAERERDEFSLKLKHEMELNRNNRNAFDLERIEELQAKVDSLTAERDGLRKQLAGKQHVIDVQRDSFLKLERENRELQDVCGELERTVENMRGRE